MAKRKSGARYSSIRAAVVESMEERRLMAFGLTTTSSLYTVDTGAGVVFSILRGGTLSSTIHLGDMTSFKYNNVEFAAPYSQVSRYSHFESGLSSQAVLTATIDPAATPQWIKITCDDSSAVTTDGKTGVIQYYIAKRNDPNIYMATYAPEMRVSSTRYITYLDGTKFTNRPDESDTNGNTGGIETADVQGHPDGTTTSKYYGETRNIDHLYHGATGSAYGAYMFIGNRERGAGGPFWKDIDWQSGSGVEIYNMPFSGHSLTDTFRPGLHGPYALNLTNGTPPTALPEYTFLEDVGITGLTPASGRGTVSGRASGVASGRIVTVGLSNTAAQFWANPDANGNYLISDVLPGTYTESIYDEELIVGQRTVTVTAGQTTRADIVATGIFGLNSSNVFNSINANTTPIWRIGNWDGTPREFMNGDKITVMHPSDTRLRAWADSTGTTNFTIGTNVDSDWPMAEWKSQVGAAPYVDTKNRITFTLNSTQRSQALTLRIGITRSDSERPGVSANGGTTQYGSIMTQAQARGLSLGNWRGNNGVYSYNFAANSLNVGTNTFDIYAISGSSFTGYFSGYHIYDAVELVPTSQNAVPTITSLTVTPATGVNIRTNGTRKFTAMGNGTLPVNAVWTTTIGSINDAGEFIAPSTTGSGTITATYGSVVQNITVNITSTAPSIASPPSASPNPTYNLNTALSILGGDDNGEAALSYTWATSGTQPGTVTFGAGNATNAGKNITATFSTYGTYSLQCTITDASGNTTVSSVQVTAQDMKLWYKFDRHNGSGLTDFSGNVKYGNVAGKFEFPTGVNKGALRLIAGAATLPNGIVSDLTNFTIASWVKADTLSNFARIFDIGTGTTSNMYLASRTSASGNPIRFAITTSGSAGEQFINGPTLASGTWTHIAITLSGTTATMYVNGVSVGTNSSMTLNPSLLGVTTQNYLGESQYSADPSFAGSIDDFRIYGRALTGSEITALSARPTVANAAAATPSPVTGTTTALSVLGADALNGEASLTYTWELQGNTPNGLVTLSANGTNAAKNTNITFSAAGTYTFLVTIANANGNSVTSTVTVVVNQTLTTFTLTPTPVSVPSAGTQQFTTTASDQFGDAMITPPIVTWAKTSGVGSIDSTGLYTASGAAGSATITATTGSFVRTANITVTNAAPTVTTAASATPNPVVAGNTTSLSVLGDDTDGGGEPSLTYTWSWIGVPPAPVTFSANGTNAAKNIDATFTQPGTYNLRVTITDVGGLQVLSNISVTVSAAPLAFTGTSGGDNYRIRASGSLDEIYLNDFLVQTVSRALATTITFDGLGGNDSLIIDYSSGDPNPSGGIIYNGGSETDTLDIRGTGSTDGFALNNASTVTHGSSTASYSGVETMKVSSGNYSVNSNLGAVNFQASGAATLTTLTKNQSFATLLVAAGASVTSASTITTSPAMVIGGVTVDNATLSIAANGGLAGVSELGSLTIIGSGKLELHNNDLVINYASNASPYSQIFSSVKNGLTLLGGAGTSGITSQEVDNQIINGTVLSVVDVGAIGGEITSTSGFNLTSPSTSIIIKYTWFGDSTLDGVVGGDDYALIDTGFTSAGTMTGWIFGDYSFDGQVDSNDYALIDTGYIAQDRIL